MAETSEGCDGFIGGGAPLQELGQTGSDGGRTGVDGYPRLTPV